MLFVDCCRICVACVACSKFISICVKIYNVCNTLYISNVFAYVSMGYLLYINAFNSPGDFNFILMCVYN